MKFNYIKLLLESYIKGLDILELREPNIRTRASFSIFHQGEDFALSMFKDGKKTRDFERDFISKDINKKLDILLLKMKEYSLGHKFFELRFLESSSDLRITLLYHKNILDPKCRNDFKALYEKLKECFKLDLIILAKKQKLVFGKDYCLHESCGVRYHLSDECFTQPSLLMNEKMQAHILNEIKKDADRGLVKDYLEAYCGCGNFTFLLAPYFSKVLSTELSKKAIFFAQENMRLNKVENVFLARLNAQELVQAINKDREFKRLAGCDLSSYDFSHFLVNPPRAGLEDVVLELAKKFSKIIYISCNPLSLKRDLELLKSTHKVISCALFDQFKNSDFAESIICLEKYI